MLIFFCHMVFKRYLIVLFLTLAFGALCAQQSFVANQNAIFQKASEQWLCRELREVNPRYFDCTKQHWVLPAPGQYVLYSDTLMLTPDQVNRYTEIWFPSGDCKRFLSIVALCDVYFPLFKRKVELNHLHPDVAVLPAVLSGCNQQYAGEDDAAGLWAMPYLAARKMHLRIDTLVDERLGGDFTTDAALQHFAYMLMVQRNNYARATVAYRYGAASVTSIDTLLTGEALLAALPADAAEMLRFQAYTLRLLHTVHTENQMSNCFDILGHQQPVIIEKPMRVSAIASVLHVDEVRLRDTNPVYTGKYLMPGYRKVPFVLEDTLVGRFKMNADSIASWQPEQRILKEERWEEVWINHRVGRGETLGRIAEKYHVRIADVKKWNKLRSDKIRKGQVLRIEQRKLVVVQVEKPQPVMETMQSDTAKSSLNVPNDSLITINKIAALLEQANKFLKQKKYAEAKRKCDDVLKLDAQNVEAISIRNQAEDAIAKQTSVQPKQKVYTVKSGDSLWSIAHKYPGVTEYDIMKWNKCSERIQPGQKLIINLK
jgi:membrane-bound lytic murein transglycosylase D